ncbi:MAG TPA: acetate kinase [Anaerolineae bacterium]|nr:acetate kinase [Anaerolineae bacterium]HIP70059.1 acetate kinase [Anaerolineae bacterium]
MKILVINSGSSSIKYQLFDMPGATAVAGGLVERIGEAMGRVLYWSQAGAKIEREMPIADHRQGLMQVVALLLDEQDGVIGAAGEITAVGHRVVHGGEKFSQPTVIDAEVMDTIRELIPLAPLHNPANLSGIEVAREIFPEAVQTAVFDTAFHQTMPPRAYRYAIPNALYAEEHIRVYGFHGTSHLYVSKMALEHLGKPAAETNLISIHLGNGASMTAVAGGKSIDTTMGFSPLPGLIMGTRSGDLDPAVIFYLSERLDMSIPEIDRLLNKQSGLLGLTGVNDVRDIQARSEAGDMAAALALEMYAYRIKKYIGAYTAVLGHLDAIIFTAGVGQNSAAVRRLVCAGLESLGIALDEVKNAAGVTGPVSEIQGENGRVKILIIPTNEELEIASQTYALVGQIK